MALKSKNYMLIYDSKYLDYFISKLKDRFIPVTFDDYAKTYFQSRGIEVIGILDYLSDTQIERITSEVWGLADHFIAELDESNRKLYKKIFGTDKINFLYATMGYFFKRFAVRCSLYLKGLEAAVVNNRISSIYYLDDGYQDLMCYYSKAYPFFFSDDISIKIIENGDFYKKVSVNKLEVQSSRVHLERSVDTKNRSISNLKSRIKQRILSFSFDRYSNKKKTLMLCTPLCDLDFILNPSLSSLMKLRNIGSLSSRFNIISWDINNNICPNFIAGQPRHNFFHEKKKPQELNQEQIVSEFSFDSANFKHNTILENFQFSDFSSSLIRNFLKTKIDGIIEYWQAIYSFHSITQIDALLWGSPPITYNSSIITEFCRVNKIPIIGMQHGGLYGSNRCIGKPMFDSDLKHCDYYFSYGFDKDTLIEAYQSEQAIPELVSVGSPRIDYFLKAYKRSLKSQKAKVKILYPIDLASSNFFAGFPGKLLKLICLQKKIIDLLASFHGVKIILEFYSDRYKDHPLKPYIENLYKDKFITTDKISFGECLQIYEVDTVIIAQQSTALNEAVGTKVNIIVYNNESFSGLTKEAYRLLSKRAIICDSQEDFLDKITDCVDNKIEQKDIEDIGFLEKYCVYKGDPEKNIVEAISHILT